jgi:hypothetical protein
MKKLEISNDIHLHGFTWGSKTFSPKIKIEKGKIVLWF